jgi:hypothetical protein
MQLATGVGALVVGGVLMWGMRDFAIRGDNVLAGFLLGVLLFVIGVASILVHGAQTVTIDARKGLIEVSDARPVGTKLTAIAFQQVADVSIGYLGKRTSFVNTYYLVLHLTDGREYPLFAPGRFFEGTSDRDVVEGWRRRLQGYLAERTPRS